MKDPARARKLNWKTYSPLPTINTNGRGGPSGRQPEIIMWSGILIGAHHPPSAALPSLPLHWVLQSSFVFQRASWERIVPNKTRWEGKQVLELQIASPQPLHTSKASSRGHPRGQFVTSPLFPLITKTLSFSLPASCLFCSH